LIKAGIFIFAFLPLVIAPLLPLALAFALALALACDRVARAEPEPEPPNPPRSGSARPLIRVAEPEEGRALPPSRWRGRSQSLAGAGFATHALADAWVAVALMRNEWQWLGRSPSHRD
jgi:hypothetical protein